MATVTGMTAAAMQEIADSSVVSGEVDENGDLVLTTHGGDSFIAGQVKGPKGDDLNGRVLPQDSETIDLTATGSGTDVDPWVLRADIKYPPFRKTKLKVSGYDTATNGWYVTGTDNIVYGPFKAVETYFPGIGDETYVDQASFGNYVLAGRVSPFKPLIPANATNIRQYNTINGDNQWSYLEVAVVNGFTNLRGLLSLAVAGAQTITTLPPEARPDFDMVVKVNNSDVIRALYIYADGRVITSIASSINGFYSLDGIVFPAKGKANWTFVGDAGSGLAFANGWGHFSNGTSAYGKVGFWRDEYDYIWTTGLIAGGTTTANTQMIVISNPSFLPWDGNPVPSATGGEQHVMVTANEVASALNIVGGTINAIRTSSGGSSNWISLCAVHYLSSAAYVHPDWVEHPTPRGIRSGWSTYAAGYPTFAYRQRPDGMVTVKGLIKGTALGPIDWMPDGYRSERSLLLSNVANGAYARIDMQGRQQTATIGGAGLINLISGSTTWFSLDGLHWFR